MPQFSKEALSKYIGTGCKRQLRLYLVPDNQTYRAERQAQHMPDPQPPRPGLAQIVQAGHEWEAAKVGDLAQTFGVGSVVGAPYLHASGQTRYSAIDLRTALGRATIGQFVAEGEYTIGAGFETALGIAAYRTQFGLSYAKVRPDLIELMPPGRYPRLVLPDGDIRFLPPDDGRIQLRVIDIKLTAEPSPPYFAEVTLYAMALAGWLRDERLDQQYVVVPDGAIWPGSHDASELMRAFHGAQQQGRNAPVQELRAALERDLELVPFEAFSFRLQRFFREELPAILSQPWQALPFHVDNRCRGCEYLGYPWQDARGQLTNQPDHCMPTAMRQDHLSRIAFVTRGASAALQDQGIASVTALSTRQPSDPAFNAHQELRATRTVVAGRAVSLATQEPAIPPAAGTSAVMPRWADLHIYLSADFDIGSAITIAFGVEAFWMEPLPPFGQPLPAQRRTQAWRAQSFVVGLKDLSAEQRELTAFLSCINDILTQARNLDPTTTVQFYLWDTLQYDHLTRVLGRHLQAILRDQGIQRLAWLFPPEQLLPNPAMATRQSPITVVRDVVRAVLAAPIPHYYSLLQIARVYHPATLAQQMANLQVHPLFEDELSDQIPSERAHEIWSQSTRPRHWAQQLQTLRETVRKRLFALSAVTRRLEDDLQQSLGQTAAPINIQPPTRQDRISADGQLWYAFAKLDEVLTELEVHQKRAMPPHEREARFDSARLTRRLTGAAAAAVLAQLNVPAASRHMVYELRPESCEVKLREGEFNVALAPEQSDGYLDRSFRFATRGTWLEPTGGFQMRWRMEDALGVRVVALDREHGFIVLDADQRRVDPRSGNTVTIFEALEALGLADFSRNVILDPTHQDFFTTRLRATLQAIGNPPAAQNSPLVQQALGQTGRGARRTVAIPAADVLWDANAMHAARVERQLAPVQTVLAACRPLNASQWQAWEEALTRRMQLIWGPPGTGKSRTVTSVILGAALEAMQHQHRLRILLSASTYTAIDNVLAEVYSALQTLLPQLYRAGVFRLRSAAAPLPPPALQPIDVELNGGNPQALTNLWDRLTATQEVTIVGSTPQQVHNLLTRNGSNVAQQEVFDLIVIDEASQMDVAHATLALAAMADAGSVVLAGDPLQLAPIHKAEAPLGLEDHVGSIYTYCKQVHHVPEIMLDENYRSNATLVAFAHYAGYQANLASYSPQLELGFLTPLPTTQPATWPASLYWTSDWTRLLDPAEPAVCFVYAEGRSSQSNPFEADAVAALLWLLSGRLTDQPRNQRDPAQGGAVKPASQQAYTADAFWQRGVGVVTPHRAQQGLIVDRLRQVFPQVQASLIRDAVDTVERFQGQERDVIVASLALGDPDAIFREDEFLLGLNRFNVLASRARAKLVVFVTQEVVDHLSGDIEVLRESCLLKAYAQSFCSSSTTLVLGHLDANGLARPVSGVLRSR